MCRLRAAVLAALLLPATTPIILGTTLFTTALLDSAAPSQAQTTDNLLAQAKALLGKKGSEQEVIWLSNQVLFTIQSADAYLYRAYAKYGLGYKQGAIADYNQAIAIINPRYAIAYNNRGSAKYDLGDKQGACSDYKKASSLGNKSSTEYLQGQNGAWCRNMR